MRFEPKTPTAEQVRLHREETGAGMMEAKLHFTRIARAEALGELMRDGDLEEKVGWLLRRYAEQQGLPFPESPEEVRARRGSSRRAVRDQQRSPR